MDERIFKQGASGTTYFELDPGGVLRAEVRPNGLCIDYVWLNGRLVTVMTNIGQIYPVHDDQTGRPVAMTNQSNQTVIWAAQGLPFTQTVTTNTLGSTFGDFNIGFPGQYYDSESGLWHNGNRDYDPGTGRYIESDPAGLAGGVNTYIYAVDDPITNVDPLGLVCPPSRVVVLYGKTINMGSFSIFSYQLEDAYGDVLDGPGYTLEEDAVSQVPINTSNNLFVPVVDGQVEDIVGWEPPNLPTQNADVVASQSFIVQYQGQQYTLTTVLQHENQYTNGVYNNTVTVVHQ